MPFRIIATVFLSFAALLLLCSCDGQVNERSHPLFVKAQNLRNQDNYADAVKYYEEYLLINPKSARTHSELATLYDDQMDDPLMAVYHYRQYLKYEPESSEVETIGKWLKAAEKKYYLKLKESYQNSKVEDFTTHRREKAVASAPVKEQTSEAVSDTPPPEPSKEEKTVSMDVQPKSKINMKFYIVKERDTLQRIASVIYGNSKYYKLIYKANEDILPSETRLIPGQKLRIPPLPSE
ncbi:MAG: hypothetical protein A2017_08455 [Lentisphaerae bacterium GWF2_44_16]|nr:MAG: hypothetical protein A2017_08455 [Lentisphaerae bacterium GWF2_44_16]